MSAVERDMSAIERGMSAVERGTSVVERGMSAVERDMSAVESLFLGTSRSSLPVMEEASSSSTAAWCLIIFVTLSRHTSRSPSAISRTDHHQGPLAALLRRGVIPARRTSV